MCIEISACLMFLTVQFNCVTSIDELNETFFPPLISEVSYNPAPNIVSTEDYPWLGRAVPTPYDDFPTLCPVACLQDRVFVTAAVCVIGLTVGLTSISYQSKRLEVIAIVVPSPNDKSKQYFDDAGFLVTAPVKASNTFAWHTISVTDLTRTDNNFKWFDQLNYEDGPMKHVLMGFTDRILANRTIVSNLYTMDVNVGIRFCQKIYSRNFELNGYFVPCVSPCTYEQFLDYFNNRICRKQIAVEGSMVINREENRLFAVATWAAKEVREGPTRNLPVGIAILNSVNFWNDYICALKIRDLVGSEKNYQAICDN